jgi:flagellar basal-body rod modification protein FlgD
MNKEHEHMNPISKVGGNLADLLSPVLGKAGQPSPSGNVAQSDDLKAALLKAIQDGSTTGVKAADTGSQTNTIFGGANSELGKDSFLQLLVLQMQNQDPLEPTDNAEMIAQLAQFSALEQMNNLNEKFAEFAGNLDQLNFLTASGMIGREVSGIDVDGELLEGTVDGVQLIGSVVYLTVGERQMSMAGVETIR